MGVTLSPPAPIQNDCLGGLKMVERVYLLVMGPSDQLTLSFYSGTLQREGFKEEKKNAGHEMAIVGEPCNGDACAKIPALFKAMLCSLLCVHMYCTH